MIVAKQGAITSPAELYCSILYKQFNIATPQMHVKKTTGKTKRRSAIHAECARRTLMLEGVTLVPIPHTLSGFFSVQYAAGVFIIIIADA